MSHSCPWFWGSHACDLPCHRDGNHQCIEDGEVCHEVGQNGKDEHGHQWQLYGPDLGEIHPRWSPLDEQCSKCGSPTTLISVGDGVTWHCCTASSCGCNRGCCGWYEERQKDAER